MNILVDNWIFELHKFRELYCDASREIATDTFHSRSLK